MGARDATRQRYYGRNRSESDRSLVKRSKAHSFVTKIINREIFERFPLDLRLAIISRRRRGSVSPNVRREITRSAATGDRSGS